MNIFDYLLEEHRESGKVFVVGRGKTICFSDLCDHRVKIGRWLSEEVGRDRPVLLLCENSVFFIAAYFVMLHSGNVCTQLDLGISGENLRFIVGLSEARMAVVQTKKRSGTQYAWCAALR